MKKRIFLLGLVILITFFGGFLVGNYNQEEKMNYSIKDSPNSNKKPIVKELPKINKTQSSVLMGYIQDFRDPSQIDFSKLTHVIFSFAHPTKDGELLVNGEPAMKNLRSLVSLANKQNTKVTLAIGGWYHITGGESYDYFKSAISNPTSRTKLVNELISFVDRENVDGIDVDFEHPRSKEDAQNLTLFMKDLSEKLHPKKKELSIAVHSKIHGQTLTELAYVTYQPQMFSYVDYVNIMAYDGQWDGGYHPENLSPYPFSEKIVNYWSKLFDTHGISKEKLVLGVPFYAQPEDSTIKQVSIEAIINNSEENANKDTVKMNGTTYYYNGSKTLEKKTNLAIDNGFGGMMIWELGQDAKGSKSMTSIIHHTLLEQEKQPRKYYSIK